MNFSTLPNLVRKHREAHKPQLNLKGFVEDNYCVGLRFFEWVASGKKKAPAEMLRRMSQAHVRLFPTEPVLLQLPLQPPVLIGDPSALNSSN